MRWLQFILSHSIFISLCAVALCSQTYILLHLPVDKPTMGFIFFSTLGSYNFYWILSKFYFKRTADIRTFLQDHASNLLMLVFAAAGISWYLVEMPDIIPSFAIAGLLTLLYSLPLWPVKALAFTRRAGFLKTVLLAFTWTYVTVLIPVQQQRLPAFGQDTLLLFGARFLFMLMLCIIFDSRDIHVDKLRSLRSLATDVNKHTLKIIMAAVFAGYLLMGILLRIYYDDGRQVLAFLITGLVTLQVYRMSLRKQGYLFYYFGVDGLMLFSALSSFLASI
ncbi:MAG TPA: hypothetical protein PLC48_03995 [Ferruginibacter sp.]|nr:hypothetical protein [Ferruginibacter sp.]